MQWHVGTLDDDPFASRSFQWMKRGHWFGERFPADVLTDITVFLRTPGLDTSWIAKNFQMQWEKAAALRNAIAPFETVRAEVIENWLSVTREDAIRFVELRPKKRSTPPLVSQLKMIDDVKAGMSLRRVASDYGVSVDYVHDRARFGPSSGHGKWKLPPEFAMFISPPAKKWAGLERAASRTALA